MPHRTNVPDSLKVQTPEILYDQPDRLSIATWRVGSDELYECNLHSGMAASALTLIATLLPEDARMLDGSTKSDGDWLTVVFHRHLGR